MGKKAEGLLKMLARFSKNIGVIFLEENKKRRRPHPSVAPRLDPTGENKVVSLTLKQAIDFNIKPQFLGTQNRRRPRPSVAPRLYPPQNNQEQIMMNKITIKLKAIVLLRDQYLNEKTSYPFQKSRFYLANLV